MNKVRVIVKIMNEEQDPIGGIIPLLEYNNVTEIIDPCRLFSSILFAIKKETGLDNKQSDETLNKLIKNNGGN